MIVRIPGLLRSYTGGAAAVDVQAPFGGGTAAPTLDDVLQELDRRFPGFRFRIVDEQAQVRPHIKLFIDAELVRDLAHPTAGSRELMVVGALSGG